MCVRWAQAHCALHVCRHRHPASTVGGGWWVVVEEQPKPYLAWQARRRPRDRIRQPGQGKRNRGTDLSERCPGKRHGHQRQHTRLHPWAAVAVASCTYLHCHNSHTKHRKKGWQRCLYHCRCHCVLVPCVLTLSDARGAPLLVVAGLYHDHDSHGYVKHKNWFGQREARQCDEPRSDEPS